MADIFHLLFYPLSNGIMTVLTSISLLYWLVMFFSGDGIDTDTDFYLGDVSDADVSTDSDADVSFGTKVIEYIHVGKIPIMVIVTLFKFISWIITLLSSIFLGVAKWGFHSVWILLPIFLITYFLMHYLTKPLVKLYKNLGYNGEEPIDFLGRTGILKSTIQDDRVGMVEIVVQKDVFRIHVKSFQGKRLEYGQEVVITKVFESNIYEAQSHITLENIY